jgi:hypothetical protein
MGVPVSNVRRMLECRCDIPGRNGAWRTRAEPQGLAGCGARVICATVRARVTHLVVKTSTIPYGPSCRSMSAISASESGITGGPGSGSRRADAGGMRLRADLRLPWHVRHRRLPSRCGSRVKEVRCSLLIAITDDPGLAAAVQGRDHGLWRRLRNRRRVHDWVRHGRVRLVDRLVHGGGARRRERRKNRSRYRCGSSGGALCCLFLRKLHCGLRLGCRRRLRWRLGLRWACWRLRWLRRGRTRLSVRLTIARASRPPHGVWLGAGATSGGRFLDVARERTRVL